MTQAELIELFCSQQKEKIRQVLNENSQAKRVALTGLVGSSLTLLITPLLEKRTQHQLFLLPDRESAAFFYHDLEKLLNDHDVELANKQVHYFPSSYRRAHKSDEVDNANVKLRSEIVNKLVHNHEPYIIVSYPDAIAEKLVSTQYLKKNSFIVKKGEILPIEIFLEFLYEYEYKQEEFVFEPGQFAWRGGIFDVFSYSEEYPFRIELSGDHVESIRLFDTGNQLSIKEVEQLHIMPLISSNVLVEKRVSFFDFISEESHCWLMNLEDIKKQLDLNYKKIEEEREQMDATVKQLNPSELYITGADLLKDILPHLIIEINSVNFEKYDLILDFAIKPQNNFGKSFDYLLLEWIDNLERGYKTVFLSENDNQLERIRKIMIDILGAYNLNNHTKYTIEELYISLNMILHEGFRDETGKLCLYTDHQFFEKYHRFSIRDRYKKSEAFTLKEIYDLQPGDFVVHIDHGIGIYEGLQKMEVNGKEQEAIRLSYKDGDSLYISIHSLHKITKYVGKEGTAPTLHRLGSGTWDRLKEKTKKRVKEIAIDLIKLYAKRKAQKGFSYSPDSYLQTELEASFMYEDTPDQIKSMYDVKQDMEDEHPMDRLICGDVGFGKTEIAIRAAFKAVCDSKQVAILVPTTVLALQHYTTFSERLAGMPCTVDYINRFKTAKQIKETLAKLKEGKVDILIGTHRLLSKDVIFKDLGLLIIDEEQKFGVAAKEKLRELKVHVDTLTMSATPIPRTLQFSLMGARDISVISTP
ncbi:MAG: CarD family transcriptional regulator, partial [Bacteroidales bacterium]